MAPTASPIRSPTPSVYWDMPYDDFNTGRPGEPQELEYNISRLMLMTLMGLIFCVTVAALIYRKVYRPTASTIPRILGPALAAGHPAGAAIIAITLPGQPKGDPEKMFNMIADMKRVRIAEKNGTLSGGFGESSAAPGMRKGKIGGWW